MLGDFGDDPNRYQDARSRRNYAGASPSTRASGKKRAVLPRFIRDRHLADACCRFAFCATNSSSGPAPCTTSTGPREASVETTEIERCSLKFEVGEGDGIQACSCGGECSLELGSTGG